jgi:dTDP-4-dehydrorhamnose reductase
MTAGKPILLIGRNGQIGGALRQLLAPLGAVVAPDRARLDLASPDSIRRAVRETAPAMIVNAAAYTAVDKAEDEPDLARAINGTAPGILAEEAKRLAAPLVHYSTDYVFDGTSTRPYTEADAVNPLGVYGRTKLAGEEAIAAVGPVHLILRTSWLYSMHGNNFLLTMRRLAAGREELRVVADQHGAPTWARWVAEATAAILEDRGDLADRSGLYHLTAGGETSWHGFAEAIVESMRASGEPVSVTRVTPITTADYPTPAARPVYSVLDCTKAAATFGISITDWRDQMLLCLEG